MAFNPNVSRTSSFYRGSIYTLFDRYGIEYPKTGTSEDTALGYFAAKVAEKSVNEVISKDAFDATNGFIVSELTADLVGSELTVIKEHTNVRTGEQRYYPLKITAGTNVVLTGSTPGGITISVPSIPVPTKFSSTENGVGTIGSINTTYLVSALTPFKAGDTLSVGSVVYYANGYQAEVSAISGSTYTGVTISDGGGFVQVQSDWAQTNPLSVDFIKSKPTIPSVNDTTIELWTGTSSTSAGSKIGDFTLNQSGNEVIYFSLTNYVEKESGKSLIETSKITKLDGIESGAQKNVQSDWDATSGDALILHKPTIPAAANDSTITINLNGTLVDTFTLNQSTPKTINIPGASGAAWGSITGTLSSQTDLNTALGAKVDTESGKSLIETSKITKLDGIESGAQKNVQSDWDATSGDALILHKPTIPAAANDGTLTIKVTGESDVVFGANQASTDPKEVSFAKVAKSGSYDDLTNQPSIPAAANNGKLTIKISGETDIDFTANQADSSPVVVNLAKVAKSGSYADLSNTPAIPTPNDGKLTIKISGETDIDFTANQADASPVEVSFAAVAKSGSYADLSNTPAIPSPANDSTITINLNGTFVDSFTLNQSAGKTIDIPAPTNKTTYWSTSTTPASVVVGSNQIIAKTTLTKLTGPNATADLSDFVYGTDTSSNAWEGIITATDPTDVTVNILSVNITVGATWGGIGGTIGNQTDLANALGDKVDKVANYDLVLNTEITKLEHAEDYAQKNVQSNWGEDDPTEDAYIIGKPTIPAAANDGTLTIKVTGETDVVFGANQASTDPKEVSFAKVAKTGSYADLSNTPALPNNNTIELWTGTSSTSTGTSLGNFTLDQNTDKALYLKLDNKVDKVDGYKLTKNDLTDTLYGKLNGIADGAEVNVQSDWSQTTDTADDYIKNKPTIPAAANNGETTLYSGSSSVQGTPLGKFSADQASNSFIYLNLDNKVDVIAGKGLSTVDYTSADYTKLSLIEAGAQKNIKPNWKATAGSNDEILNRPNISESDITDLNTKVSALNNRSMTADIVLGGDLDGNMVITKYQETLDRTVSDTYVAKIKPGANILFNATQPNPTTTEITISAVQSITEVFTLNSPNVLTTTLGGETTVLETDLTGAVGATPSQGDIIVDSAGTNAIIQSISGVNIGAITTSIMTSQLAWGGLTGEITNQTDLQTALSNKVDTATGYKLTKNDFTDTLKSKLDGIDAGAQVNVKPDWKATAGTAAEILNKPDVGNGTITIYPGTSSVPGTAFNYFTLQQNGDTDFYLNISNKVDKIEGKGLSEADFTTTEKTKLANINEYAEVNVQSDWKQTTDTADDFIKNKPTIGEAEITFNTGTTSIAGTYIDKFGVNETTNQTIYLNLDGKVDKEEGKQLMLTTDKTKLDGIYSGAQVNVQSNWNQTTDTADDYIKNRPNIASTAGTSTITLYAGTDNTSSVVGNFDVIQSSPAVGSIYLKLDDKLDRDDIVSFIPTDNDWLVA